MYICFAFTEITRITGREVPVPHLPAHGPPRRSEHRNDDRPPHESRLAGSPCNEEIEDR